MIGTGLGVLIGGGVWALVVTMLDPGQAGVIGYVLFFLSLFVWLASLSGLLGYAVRRLVLPKLFPTYVVRTSLRQGIMIGLFLAVLLLLQLLRLYQWWVAVVTVVLLVSFELVFVSYDRVNRRRAE